MGQMDPGNVNLPLFVERQLAIDVVEPRDDSEGALWLTELRDSPGWKYLMGIAVEHALSVRAAEANNENLSERQREQRNIQVSKARAVLEVVQMLHDGIDWHEQRLYGGK